MSKTVKLQWKPTKSHNNHLDDWNHFTQEGQVGEYPEEIAKEKLADFPNNFVVYKAVEKPKKKAQPQPGNLPEEEQQPEEKEEDKEKAVEEAPDKMQKDEQTKKK